MLIKIGKKEIPDALKSKKGKQKTPKPKPNVVGSDFYNMRAVRSIWTVCYHLSSARIPMGKVQSWQYCWKGRHQTTGAYGFVCTVSMLILLKTINYETIKNNQL
jgi:hypothetical protein